MGTPSQPAPTYATPQLYSRTRLSSSTLRLTPIPTSRSSVRTLPTISQTSRKSFAQEEAKVTSHNKDTLTYATGLRSKISEQQGQSQFTQSLPYPSRQRLQKLPCYSLYWESKLSLYLPHSTYPHALRRVQRQYRCMHNHAFGPTFPAPQRTRLTSIRLKRCGSKLPYVWRASHRLARLSCSFPWSQLNPICQEDKIGYDHCTFFESYADKHGTRLADKNLHHVYRMIPPTNLPELRHVNGVLAQSKSYIINFAHIAHPLNALTKKENGQHVQFTWGPVEQLAYDTIRNQLLDGVHLFPVVSPILSNVISAHSCIETTPIPSEGQAHMVQDVHSDKANTQRMWEKWEIEMWF